MNIQAKTDYSTLFSSLSGNQTSTFSLADYASIKNGSYFKVMKAYYGKDAQGVSVADQTSSGKGAGKDTAATNANVESKASGIVKSCRYTFKDRLRFIVYKEGYCDKGC